MRQAPAVTFAASVRVAWKWRSRGIHKGFRPCVVYAAGACLVLSRGGCKGPALVLPSIVSPYWFHENSRLPLLITAILFICLSVVGVTSLLLVRTMESLLDRWSPQIQQGIHAHIFISVVGAVFYMSEYALDKTLVIDSPIFGAHLLLRNVHWLISTPIQWYIFGKSFTKATSGMLRSVYVSTISMQVFGGFAVCMSGSFFLALFGTASTVAFALMFWFVFQIPLVPETRTLACRIRIFILVMWTAYPIASFARWAGCISPWLEQVIIYSTLDVCAKCITFTSVILARVVLTFASISGTLQLVQASHDIVLAVDQSFQLLDAVRSMSLLRHYFDENSSSQVLLHLCINEEHQARLREAARVADSQPFSAPSPKCMVALKRRGGCGEILAECFVSKYIRGRRVIGIVVASISGNAGDPYLIAQGSYVAPGDALSNRSGSDSCSMISATERHPYVPVLNAHPGSGGQSQVQSQEMSAPPTDMQLTLALHKCSEILQLTPSVSNLLRGIFLHQKVAAAVFFFDSTSGLDAEVFIVAFSAHFSMYLPAVSVPHPLTSLLDDITIRQLVRSIMLDELRAYQQCGLSLRNGMTANVTAVPLNRLSMSPGAMDCTFVIGALTFEFEGAVLQMGIGRANEHRFWYSVCDRLQHITCSTESFIERPGADFQEDFTNPADVEFPIPAILRSLACMNGPIPAGGGTGV